MHVIKYLNTNCIYCIKLLPIFNEIFQSIKRDSNLRENIRIIGISARDTLTEVEEFKKKYPIHYPVVSDTDF